MNIRMGAEQSTSSLPDDCHGAGASPQPELKDEDIPLARPFLPPMSTVDVLAQFQNLNMWTCIGEDDELMVGASCSLKRKAEDAVETVQENDVLSTASLVARTNGMNTSQDDEHNHTLQSSTAHTQGGRKKKRLFLSRQALEVVEGARNGIADRVPKDHGHDSMTSMAHLSPRLGLVEGAIQDADSGHGDSHKTCYLNIFDDGESGDEGYCTNPSFSSASGSPQTAEDEDQVVRTLAKLHQRSAIRAQDECEVESDAPSPQEQLAADARSREEAAGAERSRLLRERKLSGDISGVFGGYLARGDESFVNGGVQQGPRPTQDVSTTPAGARNTPSDGSTRHLQYTSYKATRPAGSDAKLEVRKSSSFRDSGIHVGIDRDSDHNDDYDIDHDFDLVKRHVEEHSPCRAAPNGSAIRDSRARYIASDPNPASRTAANQWRTQNRDKYHNFASYGTDTVKGNVDAESRLRALTQQSTSSRELSKPLLLPSYSKTVHQKFYGLEPEPRPKPPPRATLLPSSGRTTSFDSSINVYGSAEASQQRRTVPNVIDPLSRDDDESDEDGTEIPLKELPDVDIEDNEEVVAEHSRLKDQKRDLDALKGAYWETASIFAMDDLTPRERDELRELRKFVKAVLIDQKTAKIWRKRALDIRANMKTRLEKLLRVSDPPTKSAVNKCFTILLKDNKITILAKLIKQNEDREDDVKTRRYEFTDQRKKNAKRLKRVRFAEQKPKQQRLTKAEHEVSHIEALESTLNRMPGGRPARLHANTASMGSRDEPGIEEAYADPESESEISEETEGEDNYPGAGVRPSEAKDFMGRARHQIPAPEELVIEENDMEEIHRLDEERQREQAAQEELEPIGLENDMNRAPVAYGFQAFDKDLLRQMRRKDRERGITHPFDDLDELSDDSSVPTGIVQQFRYNVIGAFKGSARYSEGVEQPLRYFQNEAHAQAFLRRLIMDLADENASTYGNDYDLSTTTRGGRYEQMLVMGDNGEVSARVWIAKEVINVDLNKIAATKAQKRKLAKERIVYRVSITITSESATTSTAVTPLAASTPVEEEEEDDLFGRSRSPTPTPMPTRQPPTPTGLKYFTLPSLANRYAKDTYMHWYSQCDPSFPSGLRAFPRDKCTIGYSGMLGHLSTALDEELKVLGNEGCWKQKEEVVYEGRKEKCDVLVEEVIVQGPGN